MQEKKNSTWATISLSLDTKHARKEATSCELWSASES